VANNPEDAAAGMRMVPFSREVYIEQDDFRRFLREVLSAVAGQGSAAAECVLCDRGECSERRDGQGDRGTLHL